MSVTSTDRLLGPAITETLDALDLLPEDAAAAQLARRIAQQLDDSAFAERAADKVLRAVVDRGLVTGEEMEALDALKRKLSARTAVADLAPKLLAVLIELGATRKARAALGTTKPKVATAADQAMARLRAVPGA
jgi:hypothetical protein